MSNQEGTSAMLVKKITPLSLILLLFASFANAAITCNYSLSDKSRISDGGINRHWALKADTQAVNVDIKRLNKVPSLENETLEQIGSHNVRHRVGEISLAQQDTLQKNPKEVSVLISLKINGIIEFSKKAFVSKGTFSPDGSVVYVMRDLGQDPKFNIEEFEILYYPDLMKVIVQSKDWPSAMLFRLNHPKRYY